MRDRTPGLYTPFFDYINFGTDWRILVLEDGSALATSKSWGGFPCPSALHNVWRHSRRCELAATEFFAMCSVETDPSAAGCIPPEWTLDPWLVDCVDEPASCD